MAIQFVNPLIGLQRLTNLVQGSAANYTGYSMVVSSGYRCGY